MVEKFVVSLCGLKIVMNNGVSGFESQTYHFQRVGVRSLISLGARLFLVVLIIFTVACVNQPPSTVPEVPIEERGSVSQPASKEGSLNRATALLIVEAQRQFENNDWRAAIATAERGLRVDRREVRLYLVIAKSYRALGNLDLSKQFAEQGLRYVVEPTSDIALEFNRLLKVSF